MLGFSPLATNPLAAHGLYVDITPSGGAVFGGGASYKVIFARAASGNIIVSNNNLRLLQSWASTTVTSGTGSVTWGQARTPGSLLVLAIKRHFYKVNRSNMVMSRRISFSISNLILIGASFSTLMKRNGTSA